MMAVWAFLVLAFISHSCPVLGMLHCDPVFVKTLDQQLSAKVPTSVSDRQDFVEHVKKDILGVYRSSFNGQANLRIIDIRSVAKLKKMVLENLKRIEFRGMTTFILDIMRLKQELAQQMKQLLQNFADLACLEDCALIEGPVLDSWTCLRIKAHCFRGSVCGEQDDIVAEKNAIGLYVVLVLEFVIASTILILCYLYYKMKMALLKEREIKHLWKMKNEQEDGDHAV